MDIRNLKKQINHSCSNLALECLMATEVIPGIDEPAMQSVVDNIAALQQNSLKRCNFHFDKSPREYANGAEYRRARREYFHKAYHTLVEDYNKQVEEIVAQMNAALPKTEKKEA